MPRTRFGKIGNIPILAAALLLLVAMTGIIIWPDDEGYEIPSVDLLDSPQSLTRIDEISEEHAARETMTWEDDTEEEVARLKAPRFDPMPSPGWNVWGKVTDKDGKPLTGAKVMLSFIFDGHEYYPPVYTNERGIYKLNIPASDLVMVLPPRDFIPFTISGQASAPGHSPRTGKLHKFPHPKKAFGPLRLDFKLEPGVFLRGRVILADGKPAPNIDVALWGKDQHSKMYNMTLRDGCYAIPIKEAGTFKLRAGGTGNGFSPSIIVELDPARDQEVEDLVLSEFGTIEGVVVDPDGYPIAGQCVTAFPEKVLDSLVPEMSLTVVKARKRAHDLEAEQEGVSWGGASTNREGRFRITGLKKGRYYLRTQFPWKQYIKGCKDHNEPFGLDRDEEEPPAYDDPFERVLYETGRQGIRIVHPIHRLKVTLRDENGLLIPEGELGLRTDYRNSRNVLGGICLMKVEPGPLHLTAHTWYKLYAEKEIVIDEARYFTEVDLTLEKGVPPEEELLVLFTDQRGRPLVNFERMSIDLRGRLYKLSSKKFDIAGLKKNEHGEFILSVLPDSYRLSAKPGGDENFFLKPWSKEITVLPGQENRVTIPLTMGGKIALTLHWSGAWKDQNVRLWARDGDGSYDHSSRLTYPFRSDADKRVHYKDLEPDNEYGYSMLLQPGTYRVGVQPEDGSSNTVEFTIEPGKITPVELWL